MSATSATQELLKPVIVDNGTTAIRVGLAGDSAPKFVFPPVVGRPQDKKDTTTYVGQEAQTKREILNINHPIQNGLITNWDDMEVVWRHAFNSDLKITPEQQPILLTETPLNHKTNREKMTQIMFETFNTPAMYIGLQPALAMYANGLLNGVVVDSGEGVTHTVPIYNGYMISDGVQRLNLAGCGLTDYLMKLLGEGGHSSPHISNKDVVRDIKENLCCVAEDYEKALSSSGTSSYKLPDGEVIHVGNERFMCCEALFQPNILDVHSTGIHNEVVQSISKCDVDTRKELFANIVLTGGTTLLQSFERRLLKEVLAVSPPKVVANVRAGPERINAVWIGGSILASLPAFQKLVISKKEYEEVGPSVVHQKK